MYSQKEKQRVIVIIQKARADALVRRDVTELCRNGLQLELDSEDQAVADSLTDDDILPEHQWLDRLEFITPEEKEREEKEERMLKEMTRAMYYIFVETRDDWRFRPEPLDDTKRFFSN